MNHSTLSNHCYRWDIFCTVIDNFGDIGICWRLAQQLTSEHAQKVRLWVDDLYSFQRICPEINPLVISQACRDVEVELWVNPLSEPVIGNIPDIVIEAFACHIPENYIALMAERKSKPVWLNMEYLSAEEWIVGCHGLQSPHPRYPLQKTFFFPGFVAGTGGLLYENGLMQRRNQFQSSPEMQRCFWQMIGIPAPVEQELRISLFGYPTKLDAILMCWSKEAYPVTVCSAEGALTQQCVDYLLSEGAIKQQQSYRLGSLTLYVMPFLEQHRYDELLWACDINFVRGEDSFVRAQWAGKPFVWQIYPQDDNAHLDKLEAFITLYQQQMDESSAKALKTFWLDWNTNGHFAQSWPDFLAHKAGFMSHAEHWLKITQKLGDFTTNMMIYCQKYL